MRLLFSALFISGFLAHPSMADYLNPMKFQDCVLFKTGTVFTERRQSYHNKWRQCWNQKWTTQQRSGSSNFSCKPISMKPAACSEIIEQKCAFEAKVRAMEATCRAKLARFKLNEHELAQRQEEFRRTQEERERLEREQNALADSAPADPTAKFVRDAFFDGNPLHEGLTANDIPTGLLIGQTGRLIAIRGGVPARPLAGSASSLSAQLRLLGTQFVEGAHRAVLEDLRSAVSTFDVAQAGDVSALYSSGIYDSNNPRPFATQLDEAYALNADLQAHVERVANAALRLPLNNQSVVNTATGNLLSEIVKARASGDVTSLSNALTDYVAAVRDDAVAEYQSALPASASEAKLRRERLEVLAEAEKEVARLAAIARANAPPKPSPGGPAKTTRSSSAKSCIIRSDIYLGSNSTRTIRTTNTCRRGVTCRNGSFSWHVHPNSSIETIPGGFSDARCSYW